ncbi:MAG: class I SAM-dependent methyltransferase [Planctomycetota bacterium]
MSEHAGSPLPTREGYGRWAEIYDAEDNPLVTVEQPVFDRLLGDPADRDVLDVGCGTGRHALRLAARGARVVAVDFTPQMLARAQAKPGADRVRFVEHDLHAPLPFDDATFERVISALAVDHIRDLTAFFAELHRVCRPDGAVLVTMMHPAMALRGVQARFVDPHTGSRVLIDGIAHTVADYVNAAVAARLQLRRLEEHTVDAALAARSERAAKYHGWPLLLAMLMAPAAD